MGWRRSAYLWDRGGWPENVSRRILLLQSGVLGLCLSEDGYVWVGVAPQSKEVLVSGTSLGKGLRGRSASCAASGRVCPRPPARLRFTRDIDAGLEGISPAQAEVGQCADGKAAGQAGVVNYLLKLPRCLAPSPPGQIRRAPRIHRAQGHIQRPIESRELQFVGPYRLQQLDRRRGASRGKGRQMGAGRHAMLEGDPGPNGRQPVSIQ